MKEVPPGHSPGKGTAVVCVYHGHREVSRWLDGRRPLAISVWGGDQKTASIAERVLILNGYERIK